MSAAEGSGLISTTLRGGPIHNGLISRATDPQRSIRLPARLPERGGPAVHTPAAGPPVRSMYEGLGSWPGTGGGMGARPHLEGPSLSSGRFRRYVTGVWVPWTPRSPAPIGRGYAQPERIRGGPPPPFRGLARRWMGGPIRSLSGVWVRAFASKIDPSGRETRSPVGPRVPQPGPTPSFPSP